MSSTVPYTLRIFVAEGDPEGLRIVERANWTGVGLVIPRDRWSTTKSRSELEKPGVYILSGTETDEIGQDRTVLYIGQTEALRYRVDTHDLKKDFWDRVTLFVSSSNSLNRAHVTWLEWALIERVKTMTGVVLANGNIPNEPVLNEFEKADTRSFLDDILSILPLVGLTVFEPKKVIKPATALPVPVVKDPEAIDTVVVPAQAEGFEQAFIGANAWWAIRIGQAMLPKLKWIAAYQVSPISAITHIAEIDRIEPYGNTGKYALFFKGPATSLPRSIPFGKATTGAMQGPRYTSREKLMAASSIKDLTW